MVATDKPLEELDAGVRDADVWNTAISEYRKKVGDDVLGKFFSWARRKQLGIVFRGCLPSATCTDSFLTSFNVAST